VQHSQCSVSLQQSHHFEKSSFQESLVNTAARLFHCVSLFMPCFPKLNPTLSHVKHSSVSGTVVDHRSY
jgi:hypothetical protein